ncbi:MAG: ATP-binding protein [Cyanobacteria bacterium P01_D01_bin.156]
MIAAIPRTLSVNNWHTANRQHLGHTISQIHRLLETHTGGEPESAVATANSPESNYHGQPFALELLARCFELTEFEQNILLLCAGMELDGRWPQLCQTASSHAYPTFGLALNLFSNSNWEALTPSAALRRHKLLEVGGGNALVTSPLRIDERVLHYLTGVQYLDQRLQMLVCPVQPSSELVPSHGRLVETIEHTWTRHNTVLPGVQLIGMDGNSLRIIAAAACSRLGLELQELSVKALPTDWQQLKNLQQLCEREYRLSRMALLLNCEELGVESTERQDAAATFIDTIQLPLIIASQERRRQRQRTLVSLDVNFPTPQEQRQLWHKGLGERAKTWQPAINALVSQFNLSSSAIHTVCLQSQTDSPTPLWNLCRTQARPRLDELAQRIETRATWDTLVLPEKEYNSLQEISAHVAQRARVYEAWGFGDSSGRGLGISALFSGASGTGKTTAAEVIAEELNLDLYRVDLSAVVSKYIGETEKNLRRIFDAAEGGGVILLFDEADALFGKRSDVSDSKDRYANMEVSYLLQRMESYRGLAILTTNLKNSMDQAFLRRLRFVVQFPFPDFKQRTKIWRKIFPTNTPTENLVYERLAKLSIAGGNIRNIALNAAFIAANADEPVRMEHLLQAAKREYLKLERPLTDTEVKGWA